VLVDVYIVESSRVENPEQKEQACRRERKRERERERKEEICCGLLYDTVRLSIGSGSVYMV